MTHSRYEHDLSSLIQWREDADQPRLYMGVRLAAMRRRYGLSVRDIGRDAGIPKSSANDYARVAEMLVAWRGLSATRTLRDYPDLSYTHLRHALRLADCEDRIEALLAVGDGDPDYPQFSAPMTADEFGVYVALRGGKAVGMKPDIEVSGWGHEVIAELMRAVRGWTGRVLVKIWKVE